MQLPWIWGAPWEWGFAAFQLSQRIKEWTCWGGAGFGQFYSSLEQHTTECPHLWLVQCSWTSALSFPADGLEGFFKGCSQLVSFFNWVPQVWKQTSPARAACRSLPGRSAPRFLWLSRLSWAGIKRDFSFKERKASFFFPPHQKSPNKEQTKPVADVGASPLINLLVSAMY